MKHLQQYENWKNSVLGAGIVASSLFANPIQTQAQSNPQEYVISDEKMDMFLLKPKLKKDASKYEHFLEYVIDEKISKAAKEFEIVMIGVREGTGPVTVIMKSNLRGSIGHMLSLATESRNSSFYHINNVDEGEVLSIYSVELEPGEIITMQIFYTDFVSSPDKYTLVGNYIRIFKQ